MSSAASKATAVPTHEYNRIFEKLVIESTDGQVLGVIAYGAYKKAKWEWAQEISKKHGRPPSEAELKAYIDTWTPSQLENIRKNAAQVMSEYADAVINAAEPEIVRKALQGKFWPTVFTSIFSAALYTGILIAVAVVLAYAGVDLLGLLDRAIVDRPPIAVPAPLPTPG